MKRQSADEDPLTLHVFQLCVCVCCSAITDRRNMFAVSKVRSFSSRVLPNCQALVFKSFGNPPDVLEKIDASKSLVDQKLTGNQILLKFLASPVNPADINTIQGVYGVKPPLPAFAGNEGVAQVLEVGSDTKGLKVGDWVVPAQVGIGTWRTYALAVEDMLLRLPKDGLDVFAAASITVNPCTAYRMLKDYVPLQKGDTVIQNGANSSVGVNVIQMARNWGLKTVNVIRSRPDAGHASVAKELKSLGADFVVTEEDLRDRELMGSIFREIPKPKLALNCVGGKNGTDCIRHLSFQGVMVTYGGMSKQPLGIPAGSLIFQDHRFFGYWMTRWNQGKASDHPERVQMFDDLCTMYRDQKLVAAKSLPYKLEDYKAALEKAMDSGFNPGKVVLIFD